MSDMRTLCTIIQSEDQLGFDQGVASLPGNSQYAPLGLRSHWYRYFGIRGKLRRVDCTWFAKSISYQCAVDFDVLIFVGSTNTPNDQ
jgi:hypothetical protein